MLVVMFVFRCISISPSYLQAAGVGQGKGMGGVAFHPTAVSSVTQHTVGAQ